MKKVTFRKTLSFFLSLAVIFTAVSVALVSFADGADKTSFAVASDLHYCPPREELEGKVNDDIYWYANRRAAMEDESSFIIDEFLRQCAENDDCQFVLISGDLTDSGRNFADDHRAVAAKLAKFEQETGKQVYVIDGNHDIGENCETTLSIFKEIYADFGYNQAIETDESNCSYTADLDEKYRLIALDSCAPDKSTEDGMSIEKIKWVKEQADKAKEDGKEIILMMHHNLIDHMPLQRIINRNFIVRFHYTTAELFADWGIKFVFTGHEHCSDVSSYTSLLGNVIYDFATTSLSMYPLEYRLISITDEVLEYDTAAIESIDTEALTKAVKGYSDEQISLMNDGLNEYAKGFLKAGITYRLWLSLTMEKMGIEEGSIFYKPVKTLVDRLNELLEMPLCGENSLQSLAKEYNIEIPDSEYKNGWDLATELVAMHYEGEEAYDLESTEVLTLLRAVDLILLDDLSRFNDEILLSAANKILANFGISGIANELTKFFANKYGPVTAGEYLLLAIASPILYEFAFDSDGVNDNKGTLPSYGTVSVSSNISNLAAKLANFVQKVIEYAMLMLKYALRITSHIHM